MMVPVMDSDEQEMVAHDRLIALYQAEYDAMVRLAFALVGVAAEAEDIVQDSFVEVSGRLDELQRPGAYLRSVVVSRSRSALRRRQMAERRQPPPPDDLSPEAGELWDVLANLSDAQRVVVVLRYYGRYRAAEIAELLDLPASTVRSHLRRGLSGLRKELEP